MDEEKSSQKLENRQVLEHRRNKQTQTSISTKVHKKCRPTAQMEKLNNRDKDEEARKYKRFVCCRISCFAVFMITFFLVLFGYLIWCYMIFVPIDHEEHGHHGIKNQNQTLD